MKEASAEPSAKDSLVQGHKGFHREQIDWPEGEPMPESMEEAIGMGWEQHDTDSVFSDDGLVETGAVLMVKDLGDKELWAKFPFRSERVYGGRSYMRAIATGGRP